MKVVVTGANGYIGSLLCNELDKRPHIEVVKLSTHEQQRGVKYRQTDYSVENLTEAVNGASAVVHLAAKRIGTNISDFFVNERITENLLIAMAAMHVQHIVYVSSISVYSNEKNLPWIETQVPTPATIYGISKLACEHLCCIYGKKHGIRSTIFRLAPVYGPFVDNERMIAIFIKQALRGDALHVFGKSIAKRDFIYVQDVVDALVWGLENNAGGSETLNLGTGTGMTNYEIAQIINKAFLNQAPIIYHDTMDENIRSSYMDVGKLKQKGFSVRYGAEQAFNEITQKMFCKIL